MEQVRLFIAIALSFLVFFLWTIFVEPPAPPVTPESPETKESAETVQPAGIPESTALPAPEPEAGSTDPSAPVSAARSARTIRVNTPLYSVEISEKGAVFQSFVLKNYRENVAADSPLKQLIPAELSGGSIRTVFTGGGLSELKDAVFTADTASGTVDIYDKKTDILFSWQSPDNIVFEKKFSFSSASYLIGLESRIINRSVAPVQGSLAVTLANSVPEESQYAFEGPSALIDNSLEQIKIKNIEDKNTYSGTMKWIAIESRYFLSGIIPRENTPARMLLTQTKDNMLENSYIVPEKSIAPNTQQIYGFDLFFGPKNLNLLKSFENGLDRVVNFGFFDLLAKPCLWMMNQIHDFIPNYGVAIIILTIMIKIALWPLGNKSYKSMNEMKRIQPLMAEIREKYKNNKKKMNEELMNLYKIYKVNPMGGCLPMLLQIPVFFALYRMLYEAIELRHAPFFGWINDLSAPDRLFEFGFSIPFMEPPYGIPVLTIIMGATMLLQQKMSPPPGDPGQAKMMMFMPVIFTVIFINFSSGLVLYWLINNILSIAQQYYVLKKNA